MSCILQGGEPVLLNQKADGYRGLWYQNQPLKSEYRYKYSGGLGTYCAKHQPFAVYRPEVDRTFFCYGGVRPDYHLEHDLNRSRLDGAPAEEGILHMIGCFDHASGRVSQPTILLAKQTLDAHDNPVLSIDDTGYLWVFSTAHGTSRPAFVHRSRRPYDIETFDTVRPFRNVNGDPHAITNFSYMQAWHRPQQGFSFFFTAYMSGQRRILFARSNDGLLWTHWTPLAHIAEGHYQISAVHPTKAGSAFNYHPKDKGLNWRANLYYLETPDNGRTWQNAQGTTLRLPLDQVANPALVYDSEARGSLVYLKDITYDERGRPLILFLTSRGYAPGPQNNPRTWHLARYTSPGWVITAITDSDNNYDMGSLYVEPDNQLRVIAPALTGPQPFNPGGEIEMWLSPDAGATWSLHAQLTEHSPRNHTYVRRPVHAHPDFYALWADGNGRHPSASRLYFCDRAGTVYPLPTHMTEASEKPTPLPRPSQP